MRVGKRSKAYPNKVIERDGIFQASHDSDLSSATNTFFLRSCGNSAHMAWAYPSSAPVASITADNTWTAFDLGDSVPTELEIPWHLQESHLHIALFFRVFVVDTFKLKLRVSAKTLLDTVDTTTSTGVALDAAERPHGHYWEDYKADGKFRVRRLMSARIDIMSPSVPANRRIMLYPEMQAVSGFSAGLFLSAATIPAYIESLAIYDLTANSTYGE